MKTKHPIIASDFRFDPYSERVIGSNGEINASSKKDLLQRSLALQQATANREVVTASDVASREQRKARNQEILKAAFDNRDVHRVVGERMADEIYMTANRKGAMRRFLNRIDLKQGDIPRFAVRQKNATAMWLAGPTRIETEILTDKWLTPPELQIAARVFVPQNEINQSTSDVLESKYIEGLEGIMVTEDRLWYNMAVAAQGVDNDTQIISGTLSPLSLMNVRQQVARFGLKAAFCYMASDLFVDIVGDASFIQAIEPVARHELVMTGELGVLYGMTLISESYRHPEHKVLSEGEFFVVSDPATHGAYSDRGGVDSAPLDGVTERVLGKGWLLSESQAQAIANTRSVARGLRV